LNECYGSAISVSTIPAGSYNYLSSSQSKSITSFSSSGTGACAAISYSLTTSIGGVIDASVFHFTDTAGALSLAIYTADSAKIGTYYFTLTGTLVDGVVTNS
jgi:hypothetical protein